MQQEVVNEMLNLRDPIEADNSIESYQYEEFLPPNKSNFNQIGQTIQIDIQATDGYYRPSESYIHIEGNLSRFDNNNRYEQNQQITLINNAIMYLFSSIEYSAGGLVMETLNNPGQTTSILGYLVYPDDFNTSTGLSQCWNKDTTNNANSNEFQRSPAVAAGAIVEGQFTPLKNPNYNQGFAVRRAFLMSGDNNTRGNFSFDIPFCHIFGFSEYDKIMYNIKHTLKFTRGGDHLALHKAGAVTDGNITITEFLGAYRL